MRILLILLMLGVGTVGIMLTFCGMIFLSSASDSFSLMIWFLIPGLSLCGVAVLGIHLATRKKRDASNAAHPDTAIATKDTELQINASKEHHP